MPAVGEIELPQLQTHRAARLGAGCVTGLRRVAHIAPRRKIPVLILKDTLEHEKFLTTPMYMR